MPSVTLAVALAQARVFLNDTNATVWTDANLIPSMQQADQELQMHLWLIGSPVIRSMSGPLLVPAGYNPNINGILPADWLIPTLGQECGQIIATLTQVAVVGGLATYSYSSFTGAVAPAPGMTVTITGFVTHTGNNVTGIITALGTGTFSLVATTQANETNPASAVMPDNVWIPLTEQFFLTAGYVIGPTLTWWAWQEEELLFSGSTLARYVNFQYRRQIPIPNSATSEIGMTFGEMYLGARGAAIAAGSVGNAPVAAILDGIAKENFGMVVMANRGQQKPINKP